MSIDARQEKPERYSAPARFLHWLVAALVIATIPIGTVMLREDLTRPVQDTLFILHKNGGVIILVLVLARLAWRAAHPPPPLPQTVPPMQRRAARVGHLALYAALLFMATSGYVRVAAGGFPVEMLDAIGIPPLAPRSDTLAEAAQTAHHYGRIVLVVLILGHVAVTVHHMVARRDGTFWRMWPPIGR